MTAPVVVKVSDEAHDVAADDSMGAAFLFSNAFTPQVF